LRQLEPALVIRAHDSQEAVERQQRFERGVADRRFAGSFSMVVHCSGVIKAIVVVACGIPTTHKRSPTGFPVIPSTTRPL